MGIVLPQLAPASEDRVSGVPSFDGGFRFTSTGKGHLAKIPSVCGNRQRWTWSGWIKKSGQTAAQQAFMSAAENPGGSISNDYQVFYLWDNATSNSYWRAQPGSANSAQTSAIFRDNAGWYHLVCVSDITQSSAVNRMKIYVNGELQSLTTNWSAAQNEDTAVNGSGYEHGLGISIQDGDKFYDGIMAQVDFVDGRVVGPEEFAFTDPLTGTWRPKRHKLTGPNDGTVWSANCTSSTPNSGTVIADFFKGSTGSCEGFQLASGGNIVLTKDIPNVTSIGIYSNTGSSFTLTVNEGQGDAYTATVNSRNNVSILDEFTGFSGTLHTLKLSGFGAGTCLNGIAINGVMLIDGDTKNIGANGYYLPMDGNSPVGEDKSGITTPNNGTVWSQYLTGSGNNFYVGAQGISKAFDGKTDTYVQQQNTSNPNSITFAPPGGISHSSKVEVWIGNTANKVSYNGGSLQTMSSGWNTVASGSGTLTTLRFERASTSGTAVRAIRIDGHHLIDDVKGNSWKPELCGSVPVDKATGALPILNTGQGGTVARPGVLGSEVSKNYTVTVASVGGQNKYAIDGVDRPSPTLYRGGTYTFDYTTPGASHPFYLSSLLDGKHNSKAYSVEFDGTNDYLSLASSADFALGTNDWTIEYFAYPESTNQWQRHFYLIGSNANQVEGVYADSNGIAFGKTNVFGESQVPQPINQWNHYALVHDAASMRLYINGSLVISSQNNFSDENKSLNIGYSNSTFGGYFDGKISNFRVIKGTALYTSNFTPPQTTLTNITNTKLLCCQDSDATTAAVKPGNITANGGAAATQTHQPFLYNNNHGNFGVNTSTSNVTKITIPHLAADSLYYYCQNHPNMGNTTAMSVITDVQKADPYAWKCVYALPLIGSNQDVSNQINCTMSAAKAVASNGNAGPTSATSNFYSGSFDFDGNGDYLQTAYNDDFSFLNQDFTAECWVNTTQSGAYGTTIGRWTSSSSTAVWDLRAASADYGNRFIFITRNGSGTGYFVDSGVNVNDGLWHHLAVCRQGQYLMVFVDGTMVTIEAMYHTVNDDNSKAMTVGYGDGSNYMDGQVQDVRVYKGVAKYTESFVVGSASPDVFLESPSGVAVKSKLKKITDGSVFINRSTNAYLQAPASTDFRLDGQYCIEYLLNLTDYSNDSVYVRTFILDGPTGDGGSTNIHLNVNPSTGVILFWSGSSELISGTISIAGGGWHHVCLTRDSSNKTRLFIDGLLSGSADITTDYNLNSNQNRPRLGALGTTGGTTGHYSNWRIIKGSIPTEYQTSTTTNGTRAFSPPTEALTTTSQGATANDVKLIACQSNTSATAATITPGSITENGGVTATTFNPFITNINTVRGQEGAYCTWDPLYPSFATTSFSNGNLDSSLRYTNGANTPYAVGTVAVSSGKWYWEITLTQESNDTEYIGFIDGSKTSGAWVFADIGAYFSDARKAISTTPSSYGTNYTTGDVIGVALDADNGDIEFYKNGVSQGVAASGMTGFNSYRPFTSANGGSTAQLVSANFGQKPYKFPPPDGYQTLTSSVLRPETVITHPDKYFSTKLYTGNGATSPGGSGSTQTIDVGFEPDMIWIKDLTQTHNHNILDTLRGPNSILLPDDTIAEVTNSSDAVTAFTSNGFTLGDNGEGTQSLELNKGNNNYVVWSWKAGGAPTADNNNTSGAMDANSVSLDGVLQSAYTPSGSPSTYPKRMSIGTKQGFSVVQFVGTGNAATIPHGLSETPTFIIHKFADASSNWSIWTPHLSSNTRLTFTSNGTDSSTSFQNTNSSTFNVASGFNDNNVEMITYCWHDVPGMFKTGTYKNNASADGPFIELGFKPALFMLKCTGGGTNWRLADNVRDPYNNGSGTKWLKPSTTDTEANERAVDFVSNGVKIRSTSGGDINQSSNAGNITYIYAAWAEEPQFNLYGGQSSAR